MNAGRLLKCDKVTILDYRTGSPADNAVTAPSSEHRFIRSKAAPDSQADEFTVAAFAVYDLARGIIKGIVNSIVGKT
jgi:hypothetical protein